MTLDGARTKMVGSQSGRRFLRHSSPVKNSSIAAAGEPAVDAVNVQRQL